MGVKRQSRSLTLLASPSSQYPRRNRLSMPIGCLGRENVSRDKMSFDTCDSKSIVAVMCHCHLGDTFVDANDSFEDLA